MAKQTIIQNINLSGLSDSRYQGGGGSVYKCVGFDVHSEPGNIKTQKTLALESGTNFSGANEQIEAIVAANNGYTYIASTGGVIRKRDSSGTYTSGGASGTFTTKLFDMCEYNGYLFYTHKSPGDGGSNPAGHYLGRINIASAANSPFFQTITNTDEQYHPLFKAGGILYIGASNYVYSYDSVTSTYSTTAPDALDLYSTYVVQSLNELQGNLIIGTSVKPSTADNKNVFSRIFMWDRFSPSWTSEDELPEYGIYKIFYHRNTLLIAAGQKGNIYSFNGQYAELFRKIPGDWSKGGAVCTGAFTDPQLNITLLAYYGTSATNTEWPFDISIALTNYRCAIFSLGGYAQGYPDVITNHYVYSTNTTECKSIGIAGGTLLFGRLNGVESVSANYVDGSYIETRMIYNYTPNPINVKVTVHYNSIPTGGSISILISTDEGSTYTAFTSTVDSIRKVVETNVMRGSGSSSVDSNSSYQIKVVSSGGKAIKFDWIKIEELND